MPGNVAWPFASVNVRMLFGIFVVPVMVIATSSLLGAAEPPVADTFNCTGASCLKLVTVFVPSVNDSVTLGAAAPVVLRQLLISFATSTLPRPDAASYPGPAG